MDLMEQDTYRSINPLDPGGRTHLRPSVLSVSAETSGRTEHARAALKRGTQHRGRTETAGAFKTGQGGHRAGVRHPPSGATTTTTTPRVRRLTTQSRGDLPTGIRGHPATVESFDSRAPSFQGRGIPGAGQHHQPPRDPIADEVTGPGQRHHGAYGGGGSKRQDFSNRLRCPRRHISSVRFPRTYRDETRLRDGTGVTVGC